MSRKEDVAQGIEFVRSHLEALAAQEELSTEDQVRWDEGIAYVRDQAAQLDAIERFESEQAELAEIVTRAAVVPVTQKSFSVSVRTEDVFDLSSSRHDIGTSERFADMSERALTVIEESRLYHEDAHKEAATRKVEQLGNKGRVAEQIIAASSPAYRSAFARTAAGEDLTADEKAAMRQVDQIMRAGSFYEQTSERAIALTNVTAKLVPAHLDPTVILTNDGALNPLRGLARVIPVATNVWTGVSSGGVTANWATLEPTEVGDDAPTFANPTVTCHMATAFVPISFQAFEDWNGGEAEVAAMFTDAKSRLESVAHQTGSGTNQPRGIVTALAAEADVRVVMGTNSAFTPADLFKLQEALPVRYRPQAAYLANLAYINRIRQFGTNDNYAYTVDLTADGVPRLLGKPLVEAESMASALTTTTNNAIVYGDFRNYVIADRVGMVVEFVPTTFGTTNGRPMTQRGWLAHWRNGANSINDKGFRLLVNPAS
jgi:HK97 family phage major capsid protein